MRVAEIAQLMQAGVSLDAAQHTTEFLSRLFAYYLARAVTKDTNHDTGTMIRYVFQILNTFGFPPESIWPYSDNAGTDGAFTRMPSSEAFRRAFDQRSYADKSGSPVVKYSRILATGHSRVLDVQRAISQGMLVVFGTDVTEAFCSDSGANDLKPIDPPGRSDTIAGGHAMVWGGYDDSGVDTLNSWSEEFGDKGWFRMSWDYVAWASTNDLWIVEKAPLIHPDSMV